MLGGILVVRAVFYCFSSSGIFLMLSLLVLDDNLKLWGHSVYHSSAADI